MDNKLYAELFSSYLIIILILVLHEKAVYSYLDYLNVIVARFRVARGGVPCLQSSGRSFPFRKDAKHKTPPLPYLYKLHHKPSPPSKVIAKMADASKDNLSHTKADARATTMTNEHYPPSTSPQVRVKRPRLGASKFIRESISCFFLHSLTMLSGPERSARDNAASLDSTAADESEFDSDEFDEDD